MQVILKQLTGQKLTSLHKTTGRPLSENLDFGVREIFACKIRNPGIRNTAQEIRNPRLEDWNPVPGIQNSRPRIEIPRPSRINSHGVKQEQL